MDVNAKRDFSGKVRNIRCAADMLVLLTGNVWKYLILLTIYLYITLFKKFKLF